MSSSINPPAIAELRVNPVVVQALEEAWQDSDVNEPDRRHEEGGWIYFNLITGDIVVRRAPPGRSAAIDLTNPPLISDAVVVGTFHTHPNPASDGWQTGPSLGDTESADLLGVPCFIRAEDGIHTTGPNSRRGGLAGGPGFPA